MTDILLLLVNVTDLEPDILLGQGTRRLIDDKLEALVVVSTHLIHGNDSVTYIETLRKLLLLLVNYSEAEINLVGLFEFRCHTHDLGERLLRMIKRAIAIVQNTNAVPQLRLLSTGQHRARQEVANRRQPTLGSRR